MPKRQTSFHAVPAESSQGANDEPVDPSGVGPTPHPGEGAGGAGRTGEGRVDEIVLDRAAYLPRRPRPPRMS